MINKKKSLISTRNSVGRKKKRTDRNRNIKTVGQKVSAIQIYRDLLKVSTVGQKVSAIQIYRDFLKVSGLHRRQPSASEKRLRSQKYKLNRELRSLQKEIMGLPGDGDKFIKQKDGKRRKVKTLKREIVQKIWAKNSQIEAINRKIEHLFHSRVKRNGKKLEKKPKVKKGEIPIYFRPWMANSVHEYVLVQRRVSSFDGIDISTNADKVANAIDAYFVFAGMDSNDVFLLLVELSDLSSSGFIIKNGVGVGNAKVVGSNGN